MLKSSLEDLSIDDMLQFLGVLQKVQADGVPTYQVAAKRLIVQNNDVLEAQVDTPEMQQMMEELNSLADGPPTYIDITEPIYSSPRT